MIKYTTQKDKEDNRDYVFSSNLLSILPGKISLIDNCSDVFDQGELGSCTANAIIGLKEYLLIKDNDEFKNLSRLFLYWQERKLINTINEDSGASLRDGMKVMYKVGTCEEELNPYIIENFQKEPTNDQIINALNYKISGYQRIIGLKQIKQAISKGYPIVFSMEIYESFEFDIVSNTGQVQIPNNYEKPLGGHAMCIIGYDDNMNNGCLIVRNSWGSDWGDNGYCYIPYDMISYFYDAWTILYDNSNLLDKVINFIRNIFFNK